MQKIRMKIIDKNFTISKKVASQKIQDKENVFAYINSQNNSTTNINHYLKTGIEIRNKIKHNKDNFKPSLDTKLPLRKNNFLTQKTQRNVLQSRQLNRSDSFTLSNSSSVKSIKSVTFSVQYENSSSISKRNHSKSSILKNKIKKQNNLNQSEKKSIASSFCSHVKSLDQSVQNIGSNSIIIQKYEKLLKQLKSNKQKYTDSIYPPCQASIFLKSQSTKEFLSNLNEDGYKIKWVRLTELYKDKNICIWHPQRKSIITRGFINSTSTKDSFVQNVFNSINKKYIMQKLFQSQSVSNQGLYYIKMHQTQTNTWKYIIVDDYIPVIVKKAAKQQKFIKPAFLNVITKPYSSYTRSISRQTNDTYDQENVKSYSLQNFRASLDIDDEEWFSIQNDKDNNLIQIWPYLLQKAYAKYYSTYDTLLKGNTLDFLEQVTGNFYKSYQLKNPEFKQNQSLLQRNLKNQFDIKIGQTQNGLFYPFNVIQQIVQIVDIQNQNNPVNFIEKNQLSSYFTKIHVIQSNKYLYQKSSIIKQQNLLEKQLKQNKKPFIMRNFIVSESTQCHIAIIQKQQRFHRLRTKKVYEYSWIRLILVMKQPVGYRWIDSSYSNQKTIKLQSSIEAGQYFIIVIPQWSIKPFNLNLSLCANVQTMIQRKSYQDHVNIIEDSCMDLAQRYGKLIQINQNICAYNYIDYKVGFIIENINNQKSHGEVKILRTIDGLEDFNIVPLNQEFYVNKKLEIKIKSLESYTVVLKVLNGVDRNFLQQFDFGS